MADENEEREREEREREEKRREAEDARARHSNSISRLQNLRDDVGRSLKLLVDDYFNPPETLDREREERGAMRERLRRIQGRIDETLQHL